MAALAVVEDFHVIEQAGACLVPGLVVAMHYKLRLQSVEETFHRRVVPAIPFAAHALANPVLPNEIQVERGSLGWGSSGGGELGNATSANCHSERVGGQLAAQRVAHGPAHNSARVH